MQTQTTLRIAAISGALAVILGAFGAHGLKPYLDEEALKTWHTASFYHFVHTLVLLIVALVGLHHKIPRFIPILFIVGICLFSGSLYLLSTKELHSFPHTFLGPLTPIGGVFFIAGWLSLFYIAFKIKSVSSLR
ncbi:MAG: DUF423 domain-containing protein [Chitinophagaceae bacterium]|nr:DUF423 domain-containing protein [Saprospiraceae bacterium]MBP9933075.1 DUF423 domain-containing protein [Chitinophagaceae bacterium]